jgi:hypothetical protein
LDVPGSAWRVRWQQAMTIAVLKPRQIGRQRRQSVESRFSKTWFDPNIAALDRADFAQTFAAPRPAWAAPPQLRLLRLRRQRPRLSRAAEEGGELAPPYQSGLRVYGQQPTATTGT